LPNADCGLRVDNCIAGCWLLIADCGLKKKQKSTSKQQQAISNKQLKRARTRERDY